MHYEQTNTAFVILEVVCSGAFSVGLSVATLKRVSELGLVLSSHAYLSTQHNRLASRKNNQDVICLLHKWFSFFSWRGPSPDQRTPSLTNSRSVYILLAQPVWTAATKAWRGLQPQHSTVWCLSKKPLAFWLAEGNSWNITFYGLSARMIECGSTCFQFASLLLLGIFCCCLWGFFKQR